MKPWRGSVAPRRAAFGLALGGLLFLAGGLPRPGIAGPHDRARFALHVTDAFNPVKGPQNPCSQSPNELGLWCYDFRTIREELGAATIYLVLVQFGAVGVEGISCGIEYTGGTGEGIDPRYVRWDPCPGTVDMPIIPPEGPAWPASGGGLRMVWSTCQTEVIRVVPQATAGSFYVYAYSEATFTVVPNRVVEGGPELAVLSCSPYSTVNLLDVVPPELHSYLGSRVQIGGHDAYYDVCSEYWPIPAPVRATTWGRVKSQYRRGSMGDSP